MKSYRFWIVGWLVLFAVPVIAAQDIQEGALGIAWQSSADTVKGLAHVRDSGPVAYYTNPAELHRLFEQDVPGVIYGFYRGRFFAAFVKIDSLEMFSNVRERLTDAYGVPDKSYSAKSEQTVYKWKSGLVKIKLKISEKEGTMKLVYYYTPLSDKVNEEELETEQRKSPRLFPIKKGEARNFIELNEF